MAVSFLPEHIRAALMEAGVPLSALQQDPPLGYCAVVVAGGVFVFAADVGNGASDEAVQHALILPVEGSYSQAPLDYVAHSKEIGTALWRGMGFALGQDQIDNPATYWAEGALRIHRTPLDWLRANRKGICVVNPSRAYEKLRSVPRIEVEDKEMAATVRRWLEPPKPRAKVIVKGQSNGKPIQARSGGSVSSGVAGGLAANGASGSAMGDVQGSADAGDHAP